MGGRARPGLMQDILISVTPASCEYDILDLPQHAKSPNPDSPPPTALRTHIFGLESPITSTPLSRSGQSVNQPVCELEVRLYPPEYTALHHHGKVIPSSLHLPWCHHQRRQVQTPLPCVTRGFLAFIGVGKIN